MKVVQFANFTQYTSNFVSKLNLILLRILGKMQRTWCRYTNLDINARVFLLISHKFRIICHSFLFHKRYFFLRRIVLFLKIIHLHFKSYIHKKIDRMNDASIVMCANVYYNKYQRNYYIKQRLFYIEYNDKS